MSTPEPQSLPVIDVVALQDELRGLSEWPATYVRLIQTAYLESRAQRDTATALLREAAEKLADSKWGVLGDSSLERIRAFLGGQEQ